MPRLVKEKKMSNPIYEEWKKTPISNNSDNMNYAKPDDMNYAKPDNRKPENLPGDLTKPDNRKLETLPGDLSKPSKGRLQLLKDGGKINLKNCKINTAESKNSKHKNCW